MTVGAKVHDGFKCNWFAGSELRSGSFQLEELQKAEPEEPEEPSGSFSSRGY